LRDRVIAFAVIIPDVHAVVRTNAGVLSGSREGNMSIVTARNRPQDAKITNTILAFTFLLARIPAGKK